MQVEELESVELAYTLGQQHVSQVKDIDKIDKIIVELKTRADLLLDDEMGNGWRVLDEGGMPMVSQLLKHWVWGNKGLAWSYWMGMGQPYGAKMVCLSNPREENRRISEQPITFDDVDVVQTGPRLRLVQR